MTTRSKITVFAECPFSFELDEFEKTGLDVIFFGQNHYDTMAILQQRRGKEITQEEVGSLMDNQKLLSNKALMIKNFEEVVENLKECDSYIQEVLDGKRQGDSKLGRMMDDCLGQFSTDSMAMLESMIVSNFEDAVMISNLSKLQHYQLRIQEKLNQIFAESIQTQPHFQKLRKQGQETK